MQALTVPDLTQDEALVLDFINNWITPIHNGEENRAITSPELQLALKEDDTGTALWSLITNMMKRHGTESKFSLMGLTADDAFEGMRQELRQFQKAWTMTKASSKTTRLHSLLASTIDSINSLSANKTSDEFRTNLERELLSHFIAANNKAVNLRRLQIKKSNKAPSDASSISNNILVIRNFNEIHNLAEMAPEGASLILNKRFDESETVVNASNTFYAILIKSNGNSYYFGDEERTPHAWSGGTRQKTHMGELSVFDYTDIDRAHINRSRTNSTNVATCVNTNLEIFGTISTQQHSFVLHLLLLINKLNEIISTEEIEMTYNKLHMAGSNSNLPTKFEPQSLEIGSALAKDCLPRTDIFPFSLFEARYADAIADEKLITPDDLPITAYGTKAIIEEGLFVEMRRSKAALVNKQIADDLPETQAKAYDWLNNEIITNPNIRKLIGNLEQSFFVEDDEARSFQQQHPKIELCARSMRRVHYALRRPGERLSNPTHCIPVNYDKEGRPLCIIDNSRASIYITIHPGDAIGLAQLLGLNREDLPHDLGILNLHPRDYSGDPFNYIKHPFLESDHSIRFGLSIRGFGKLRKTLGLKHLTKEEIPTAIKQEQ